MKKQSAFFTGLMSAIAAPAAIYSRSYYPTIDGSDLSRMRADVLHLGNDFRSVLQREYGHQVKKSATPK